MGSSLNDLKKRVFTGEGLVGSLNDMARQFYESLLNTPQVPAFFVFSTSGENNVTGNTTDYPVLFDTELYDNSSAVVSGVHTVDKAGNWLYTVILQLDQLGVATKIQVTLATTDRDYRMVLEAPSDISGAQTVKGFFQVPQGLADTAFIKLRVDGLAGDTVDIVGIADPIVSSFQGVFVAN